MKKILIPIASFAILVACNSSSDTAAETETTTTTPDTAAMTTPATADITTDPNYQKGLEIEAKSDCNTCHKINEKLVGPSFKEIATKYAGADQATIDTLAGKVINGGSGNWGTIQMTPHPTVSKEDATEMVKYILGLRK